MGDHLDGARGSNDSQSGRARGSIRLQKSTSGARPIAAMGEEPTDKVDGSSWFVREHRTGEIAAEAGFQWPSWKTGGGFPKNRIEHCLLQGSTCRWKAL
jgi:hypothetical protein